MRDWIAVIVAVLGVLLVLAGAVLIFLQARADGHLAAPAAGPAVDDLGAGVTAEVPVARPAAAPVASRLVSAVKSPTPADRLIFWGIVLLVLAAIAAGAISFDLGARGGS
ncbi:hypothetical protein [Dactylosporangium sp. NPDC048998]|uniref:hypothetical protein n=1 Tax=Dactylosporangium sp. NPDC048998 TaxID=3363976 RepID=UPI003714223B